MNNKIIRALSVIISASMSVSAVPAFAEEIPDSTTALSSEESGRLMYEDFEDKEIGEYDGVTVKSDAAGAFSFQIVDGSGVGKDGKVLMLSKVEGADGNQSKEKVTIGTWSWGQSAEHKVVTSFSAASAKNDPEAEQITYAFAGGDSGSNIAGSFRMSKGKLGFGKGDGSAGPKDTDISGSSYDTEWHKVVMVSSVNSDNEIYFTEYYLDGQKVNNITCVPNDAKAKNPTKFRMNFDGNSVLTTTYVDDIAVVDVNKELEYLDSVFETECGVPDVIENGEETVYLPEKFGGADVVWTSSDNDIVDVNNMSDGYATVTHPDEEKSVTLSAHLTYTGFEGYEIDDISLASEITHEITVNVEQGGELSDEQKAKRAADNLIIDSIDTTAVSGDFTLPLTAVSEDGTITGTVAWSSNDDSISIDGDTAHIIRPPFNSSNKTVSITATVTVGTGAVQKQFNITLLKNENPVTDDEKVEYAVSQLAELNFNENTEKIITSNIYLPTEITLSDGTKVADISWTSSDTSWITNSGVVLQKPESGSYAVILTAVITSGSAADTKEYDVLIRKSSTVKAFPGAQGYGTQTRGGAGGYVVHVTSLGAEGPGTLKEALEEKTGARTIVFDVGGTIDLTPLGRALSMKGEEASNVTIAGQTAPGDGIQLKGYGLSISNVHDVIIRHISIRIGNVRKAGDTYQSDPLSAQGANRRIVLDHLSMCWGVDMGFRVYGQEVTMSNCMVSKGLYWNTPHEKGKHNYAGIFGPKYGSFYGNYIADCGQRAPRICDNEYIDIRNNVVFNSKYTFDICNYEWMGANTKYNVINNMVLKGNTAPGESTSNTTDGGSYKYFQGRTYSGGMLTYTVNNYDNTKSARPLDDSDTLVDGALWIGDLSQEDIDQVKKELYAFSPSGYSNTKSEWYDMILPSNMSLDEYDASAVSKKGNTLVNYPFPAPDMTTYSTEEAVKYVLTNAGAKAPVRGILDNRYLAEGRTRLQILSDYSKASQTYGIKLDESYSGDTAYGLEVHTHSVYKDENGSTVYDVDGQTVTDDSQYTLVERYKFVSCENNLDTLYAIDKDGENKYRLVLRDYTDEDGIYDAFELYDINNNVLEKPDPYVSDSDSEDTDGMHWPGGIVLRYADWGDGAGNYNHAENAGEDGNIDTGKVDTEWTADDWPQLPTVYRDGDFDSNGDGIPDFFIKLMGWDKHPDYQSDKDISRLDFEGRGYTNLEYYINDYCAGDVESENNLETEPVKAENVRDGSSKYDSFKSHEILFNTVRRAKAKVYYCEGENFDMASAKEISLNKSYNYDDYDNYTSADDFDTYFSAIITGTDDPNDALGGLKENTTYSYKIKTYSDTGVEYLSDETYSFTTGTKQSGTPGTPRIIKYVPYNKQISLTFEPASTNKSYEQIEFYKPNFSKTAHRITMIGNNEYDSNIDHYVLKYSESQSMDNAKEILLPSTATQYTITGLNNGTEYYIELRAVGADGSMSEPAIYNSKQADLQEGVFDKDGNEVYSVKSIEVDDDEIIEYHPEYDVGFSTIAVEPTLFVVNENYPLEFKELDIKDGETSKFTTIYGDVRDWYIYTLGGIPMPASYEDSDTMLMLRDDSHEHGFTYAKKFSTQLSGKSTIRAKILIHDEELDPMNQSPEFRFYIQQDSADMGDTEASVDQSSASEATSFGNIVTLQFTKNEIIYNGGDSVFRYNDDVWYDIKLLMDGDTGTCSLYINDSLIGKDLEYSESSTSTSIARWQLSSRLAGTEDVYVEYMYAYSGWDEPVIDPENTPKPTETVDEGTSGLRPSVGGGGGGGGGVTKPVSSEQPSASETPEPTETETPAPEASEEPVSEFKDMDNFEWASQAVYTLRGKGIIYGITDDLFEPQREITRAEFITLLMRGFELIGKDAVCSFEDVPDGSWYYPAVAMAYSMGVVNGYDDNYFGANDRVTRQDMAVMIVRLLERLGLHVPELKEYESFDDENQIADYAINEVITLYKAGIVDGIGDNLFAPTGFANRASAAKILYETLKTQWDSN